MNFSTHQLRQFVAAVGVVALAFGAAGCPDDEDNGNDTGMMEEDTGMMDDSGMDSGMDTMVEDTSEPEDTADEDTSAPDDTGMDTGTMGDTDMIDDADGGGMAFNFRTDDPSDYEQIDRLGMPAVSTALAGDKKDAYNRGTPADDVAGNFLPTVAANLQALHGWFDSDLQSLGLTPCDPTDQDGNGLPECVDQEVVMGGPTVGDLVVPDTITLDTSQPAGFPNGRALADPVIDVTLAVILLDMSTHSPSTFADMPLNPAMNDANSGNFPQSFPYLNPPHTP